jgi:hypothetical protein
MRSGGTFGLKCSPEELPGILSFCALCVVRKKLGLNLISAATEGGRFYRITDRSASGAA